MDVVNGSSTSPPEDGPKNSSAYKKWKQVNAKTEFILKRTISSSLFDHIIKCKSAHEIWRTLDHLFNKKNEARLQILENELASTTQGNLSISEYFLKIKNLCSEISLLNPEEAISEARMRRIVIRGLKPKYIPLVMSIQGWAQQSSLEEFENLLSSQDLLAKQLASVYVNNGERYALVANKRNFKGKIRDMLHTRSVGGSSLSGKKEKPSNYYGKKPPRCYRCASIEEIKELDSEQAVPGAIYADGDLYGESIEENVWEVEVSDQSSAILRPAIGLDQILEANEENIDQIDREVDLEGQISGETIDDITFEISKADKHIIEELERKSDGVSYYGVEASQEINDNIITESDEEANTNEISQYYGVASEEACSKILSIRVPNLSIIDVSSDSTTAGKLRERGSLGTQRRDNSHGSFDNEKSLSFDEARGVRKKLLRSSPRRGLKLRLSSSTTSVG
ncbi:hypothetical protein KY284_009739 [Solanum tuberosum]|nr:hypothetical protein KY284_009739 [Solanum tuberosum]